MARRFTFIDLFAGIGGFRLALADHDLPAAGFLWQSFSLTGVPTVGEAIGRELVEFL